MIVKKIGKLILIVILLLVFIYSIYWLWQRQPKPSESKQTQTSTEQIQPSQESGFVQSPKDSQVMESTKIEVAGKVDGEKYIVILTNSASTVSKSEKGGEFKIPIELSGGLNLINIQVFDESLKVLGAEQKTVFVAQEETLPESWQVSAGSVKTILDNLITLNTQAGEKSIKTGAKTNLVLPSPAVGKEKDEDDTIRIGDFAIALGEVKEDVLDAQDLEIIRENKPQITKKVSAAKVLTAVKSGEFNAKEVEGGKILQFTISKDSRILKEGQSAKDTDIAKDLNAIIVYDEKEDEKIVDLVYLLP